MLRTAEELAAARGQRARLEVWVGLEVADVGDEEFDLFAEQGAAELFPVVHVQADLHPRVAVDEVGHRVRHQLLGRRRPAAEAQLAGIQLVQLGDLVDQVGRPLHQAQRVLQHHLAFRRRAQVLAATVHQLTAKLLLQALDAAAEGRLGDAHGVRRADETAVFGEGDEITQLAQIHDALPALEILDKGICRSGCAGFKCKLLFRQQRTN